ncbi:unnamed protein product, partial [Prorocentrum cordatum]
MWDESQPPLEESANTFEHLEGREGLEGAQGWGGGRRLSFSPDGGLRSARPAVGPSSFGKLSPGLRSARRRPPRHQEVGARAGAAGRSVRSSVGWHRPGCRRFERWPQGK